MLRAKLSEEHKLAISKTKLRQYNECKILQEKSEGTLPRED
jgi:hypothetical protein